MVEEERPVSDQDATDGEENGEDDDLLENPGASPVALRRLQFRDVAELLTELSTPRHVGHVWWESEDGAPPKVEASHLLAVKDCLGQLAFAIKVAAWP